MSSTSGPPLPWSARIAHGLRRGVVHAPALLTASFSVLLVLALVQQRQAQDRLAEQARVESELGALRARLEATVNATFNPSLGLAALIQLEGDISAERFEALGRQLLAPVPHVRNVAAAPDDVVRLLYPHAGNEAALNLVYRDWPEQDAPIQAARARGEPLIVAPVRLVQGGNGVIQRRPVFLPAPEGRPRRYWGVLSVVADLQGFARAAGLVDHASLDVALFEAGDGLSPARPGAPIWGAAGIAAAGPALQTVHLPGTQWLLAAQPRGGWGAGRAGLQAWLRPEILAAIALGLLLSLSAAQLTRRRRQLQTRNAALAREVAQGRQVQAELNQAQARFRSLAALGSDWVWEQDAELRFTYVSRLAERATDVDTDTVIGQRRWESPAVQPDIDWAEHRALLARREAFHDFEYRQRGADGRLRHVSVSGVPVFDADGRFTGYRGIGRNLSATRRTEAALQESQEALTQARDRLQALLDAAVEVSIIAVDMDGRIHLFNRGAERMLGYGEAQMLGQNPVRLHLPRELEERAAELSRELGRPVGQGEVFTALPLRDGSETRLWTLLRSDGTPLVVSLSVSSVRARRRDARLSRHRPRHQRPAACRERAARGQCPAGNARGPAHGRAERRPGPSAPGPGRAAALGENGRARFAGGRGRA